MYCKQIFLIIWHNCNSYERDEWVGILWSTNKFILRKGDVCPSKISHKLFKQTKPVYFFSKCDVDFDSEHLICLFLQHLWAGLALDFSEWLKLNNFYVISAWWEQVSLWRDDSVYFFEPTYGFIWVISSLEQQSPSRTFYCNWTHHSPSPSCN